MTDGKRFFISYITGPSHVRVGVEWAEQPMQTTAIFKLPAIGDCEHGKLSEVHIIQAVLTGVADACRELGVSYHVRSIHYVANDSPRYDLYRYCSSLLVEHLANGGDFVPIPTEKGSAPDRGGE